MLTQPLGNNTTMTLATWKFPAFLTIPPPTREGLDHRPCFFTTRYFVRDELPHTRERPLPFEFNMRLILQELVVYTYRNGLIIPGDRMLQEAEQQFARLVVILERHPFSPPADFVA